MARWFIIPADDKLSAPLLIGKTILEKLKEMDPAFPTVEKKEKELMNQAKLKLEK